MENAKTEAAESYKVSKGDWEFILTKSGSWKAEWKGMHFAYISADAALRTLAVID